MQPLFKSANALQISVCRCLTEILINLEAAVVAAKLRRLSCSSLPSVVLPPVCRSPVSQVKQVFHMFMYCIITRMPQHMMQSRSQETTSRYIRLLSIVCVCMCLYFPLILVVTLSLRIIGRKWPSSSDLMAHSPFYHKEDKLSFA